MLLARQGHRQTPPLLAAHYSYWNGLPIDGRFEIDIRPGRGFAGTGTCSAMIARSRRAN
jgi:hypothetical protein